MADEDRDERPRPSGRCSPGFVQIPGVDDVVHRFLHGSFLDSKLYEQGPSTTAAYRGPADRRPDLGARHRDRLLRVPAQPRLDGGPSEALPLGPRLPRAQVVLRRGDRPPRRPPGPRRRPLVQRDLRALRRPGAGASPRPTSSAARAPASAPSSPATCAPTPCCWSPASPGSASTSSCRAHEERAMIQILLWAPLAAGLVACADAAAATGWVAAARAAGHPRCWRSSSSPASIHPRPPAHRRRELDPDPRCPLPARRRRDQPLPGPAHRRALARRDGLVGDQPARAAAHLVPDARAGGDGGARRLPGAGPDPLRPLLRPDADPVLLPVRELGDGARGAAGGGRGPDPGRSPR